MAENIHAQLTASTSLDVTVSDLGYVTLEQARAYVYQSQTTDESMIRQLIERASRIFDAACSLPDNYFLEGNAAQTTSTRYFWGNGTDFLSIDPHLRRTNDDRRATNPRSLRVYREGK